MKVLVTGGAGFIGSQFVRRLVGGGDEVVVLDKLTYAGNRANLEGVDARLPRGRHRRPRRGRAGGAGCEAIVNFAAETHVDRSILGPAEFIQTDVLGTQVLLDRAGGTAPPRAGLDRRGLRRRPADAPRVTEEAPLRAVQPVLASKAGGDLLVLAYVRPTASTRSSRAARTRTARASTPRKSCRCSSPTRFDGQPLPVYGEGRQRREWLTSRTTARRSSRAAQGRAGRGLQRRRRRSARTWTSSGESSS